MEKNFTRIKKLNRNNMFTYLLQSGVVSKHEIAAALQLCVPTVAEGLKFLQGMNLASEAGMMKSTGGRKALGYVGQKDAKVAIGLDITENHINMVLLNLAGQTVYSKRKRLKVHNEEASYHALKEEINTMLADSGADQGRILGMGISLPAIIDQKGKEIYTLHETISISREFQKIMQQYFSFPIILTNDTNSSGKAELGLHEDSENMIYLSLSQTMGGALFQCGQLLGGNNQRSGEIGHMTLIPDGRKCFCGRYGCADAYCASKVLTEAAGGSLEDFFIKLENGNEKIKQVWDEYLHHLSLVIHNIAMVFDSDIIIGGYVGIYMNQYLDDLKQRVKKMDTYLEDVSFLKVSSLKYEAPAIGAAAVFIDEFVEQVG